MVVLQGEQKGAYSLIREWLRDCQANPLTRKHFVLGGLAGTGKTTLVSHLYEELRKDHNIGICALTGKAVNVLRTKGIKKSETIHKLFYKVKLETIEGIRYSTGQIPRSTDDVRDENYSLIIVDEASMVGEYTFRTIMQHRVPVLFVGDHGQLPPVGEKRLQLMVDPDFCLNTPRRQALKNPIIRLAHNIRKGVSIDFGTYRPTVVEFDTDTMLDSVESFDQILCGLNKTRVHTNIWIRNSKGYPKNTPIEGDRIIAIESRTNGQRMIRNGEQFVIKKIIDMDEYLADVLVESCSQEGELTRVIMDMNYFNNLELQNKMRDGRWPVDKESVAFDYAYCITVHKAQGSEWDKVLLRNDWNMSDKSKWLYTGVTRAKEYLAVEP